jgi:hypothetical protein
MHVHKEILEDGWQCIPIILLRNSLWKLTLLIISICLLY